MAYPPGWFSEPVKRASAMHPHGWPPHFTPAPDARSVLAASLRSTEARDRGLREGKEWAHGRVELPNSPHNPTPAWMARRSGGRR